MIDDYSTGSYAAAFGLMIIIVAIPLAVITAIIATANGYYYCVDSGKNSQVCFDYCTLDDPCNAGNLPNAGGWSGKRRN